MAKDSFEVYYNQNGRWQLHMSFEANQRDLAIEEAKTVEAKEGYATRVVRESYHTETNTTEETVTWQSAKAKNINDADSMFGGGQKPPAKKKKAPPAQPRPAAAAPAPAPTEKPKATAPRAPKAPARKPKKQKKSSALVRILMAVAISFGLALLVSAGVLAALTFGTPISDAQLAQVTQGTFVLLFFLALFINLQREFNFLSALRRNKKAAPRTGVEQMLQRQAAKPQYTQDVEFDQVDIQDLRDKVLLEEAVEEAIDEAEEVEEAEMEPQELDADLSAEVHVAEEPAPAPIAASEPPPPPVDVRKPEPAKIEERKPAPPPEKPAAAPKTPAETEARASLSRFISDTVSAIRQDQLNAFSRFGMNLYIAGAASTVGQSKRLPRDVQLQVLKDGLQSAGNTAERAEAFCVELPTYGKNPRYAGMVQAGAKAITSHMAGDRNAAGGLTALLNEWNLPEKRPTVPSVITFVFTDIVGSTAMTQKLGNAGAQKAVRAHNTAVRNAISARHGREVKHTGDGIMATFPDPPSAVAAVMQMQREIAAHNSANPNLEVGVRIGVNVGEAVEEENDFFGAAVQMTARICDKATKGNIWVSQAVVDACKGQKIGFIPRGGFEMKGIQGRKNLYEVGWSDAHKNELADL